MHRMEQLAIAAEIELAPGRISLNGEDVTHAIRTPEVSNASVEPDAMAGLERTGHWSDGTQRVKQLGITQVGDGCDATTHVRSLLFGRGTFQAGHIGVGMMVKHAKRSPEAPGLRAYFSFGHKPRPTMAPGSCARRPSASPVTWLRLRIPTT
jgi:hypothetical protein